MNVSPFAPRVPSRAARAREGCTRRQSLARPSVSVQCEAGQCGAWRASLLFRARRLAAQSRVERLAGERLALSRRFRFGHAPLTLSARQALPSAGFPAVAGRPLNQCAAYPPRQARKGAGERLTRALSAVFSASADDGKEPSPMKFGPRRFSPRKSFAARLSMRRAVRQRLGLRLPRGWGWLRSPKRAAYGVSLRQRPPCRD